MFGFHNFIKTTVLYFNELVSFVVFEMKFLNSFIHIWRQTVGFLLNLSFVFS